MLNEADLKRLLEPFGLKLSVAQHHQILTYLELLLRWNRRINLTGIVLPDDCVSRHFGESLIISRYVELNGRLLDVGSGAGFPGLALRIVSPSLQVTLLEPSTKKRAFLKEVVRSCDWEGVEVRPERLEEFAQESAGREFDIATARAVGSLERLVHQATECLRTRGRLCLWIGRGQVEAVRSTAPALDWEGPIHIPLSRQREIWVGVKTQKLAPRQ